MELRQLQPVELTRGTSHAKLLCATLTALLAACAGSDKQPPARDYIVVFEVSPSAAGAMKRLAVSRVLDRRTRQAVAYLPPAAFVNAAWDTLIERRWQVAYDAQGNIRAAFTSCYLSGTTPDEPRCPESQ